MTELEFDAGLKRCLRAAEAWAGRTLGYHYYTQEDHQDAVSETVLGIIRAGSFREFDLGKPGLGTPGSATFETWFKRCVERKCKDIRYERWLPYRATKNAPRGVKSAEDSAPNQRLNREARRDTTSLEEHGKIASLAERGKINEFSKDIRLFNDREKHEELFEDIQAAEKSLPDRQWQVWRLTHHEGYSRKETAQRLGLSEKQVKKDHEKATLHLRWALKEYDYRKRIGVSPIVKRRPAGEVG